MVPCSCKSGHIRNHFRLHFYNSLKISLGSNKIYPKYPEHIQYSISISQLGLSKIVFIWNVIFATNLIENEWIRKVIRS